MRARREIAYARVIGLIIILPIKRIRERIMVLKTSRRVALRLLTRRPRLNFIKRFEMGYNDMTARNERANLYQRNLISVKSSEGKAYIWEETVRFAPVVAYITPHRHVKHRIEKYGEPVTGIRLRNRGGKTRSSASFSNTAQALKMPECDDEISDEWLTEGHTCEHSAAQNK